MDYKIYKFYPKQKIIVNRKYSSEVVATISETQKDGYIMNLIIFKDWNKFKQRYDYHVMREIELSFMMELMTKEDLNASFKSITKKYEIDRIEHFD